jgi:hypothetical protein
VKLTPREEKGKDHPRKGTEREKEMGKGEGKGERGRGKGEREREGEMERKKKEKTKRYLELVYKNKKYYLPIYPTK